MPPAPNPGVDSGSGRTPHSRMQRRGAAEDIARREHVGTPAPERTRGDHRERDRQGGRGPAESLESPGDSLATGLALSAGLRVSVPLAGPFKPNGTVAGEHA